MDIGLAVRLCREASGCSQRMVAEELGITAVHLCTIERGRKGLSMKLLGKMQVFFNTDPSLVAWLLAPPDYERTPTMERFRRSYFHRHGIKIQKA